MESTKYSELDSEELVKQRNKAMEDKQESIVTPKSAAPYQTIHDAEIQIILCDTRIKYMNDELERRAIALKNKNKIKNEGAVI